MPYRIEQRRILDHTDKHSSFVQIQIAGVLAEINIGRGLDSDCIIQEIKLVEIHLDYLLLRIKPLELYGYHPLYRLLECPLEYILACGGV